MTDSVICMFSGGKDSVCALDLCVKHIPNVVMCYMYMVPGLSWVEDILSYYQRRYKIECLQYPHPAIADMLRTGSLSMPDYQMSKITFNDVYNKARIDTEFDWIVSGMRISDGVFRSSMIKNSGTIDHKRKFIYPVARWKKEHILEYLRRERLPLDKFARKTGHSFVGFFKNELDNVVEHFPDDWEKIREFFPFVDVMMKRPDIGSDKIGRS